VPTEEEEKKFQIDRANFAAKSALSGHRCGKAARRAGVAGVVEEVAVEVAVAGVHAEVHAEVDGMEVIGKRPRTLLNLFPGKYREERSVNVLSSPMAVLMSVRVELPFQPLL
jgi:hypothetical protein